MLLISGTVGSGKSTITAEINDLLAEREIPNAAVDLDALVWQWPSTSPWNSDLMFENLAAMWPNYRGHGAERLVLGRVLEAPYELDRYRAVIPGAEITVCRLAAPQSLRERRLRQRMPPGPSLDWHLKRTVRQPTKSAPSSARTTVHSHPDGSAAALMIPKIAPTAMETTRML